MATIYCEKDRQIELLTVLGNIPELEEFVQLVTKDPDEASIVFDGRLTLNPDWKNEKPPLLFPKQDFIPEILVGFVYIAIAELEKAETYLQSFPDLARILYAMQQLLASGPVSPNPYSIRNDSTFFHNRAIVLQYGGAVTDEQEINDYWKQCLQHTAAPLVHGFSVKHYANFLADMGHADQALDLLNPLLGTVIPSIVRLEYLSLVNSLTLQQIKEGLGFEQFEQLERSMADVISRFEKRGRWLDAARCRQEAAELAVFRNAYSEAVNLINQAIRIYQQEELPELAAAAQLQKAELLLAWAQSGQPQMYRPAMEACQDALSFFNRSAYPLYFAQIQHMLGIIYSEIPDDVKKKGIWAAVSVSSFNEALNFFNKIDYPKEFAQICHNYAVAYSKFPTALHSDNFEKCLAWFREALDIRTAADYPAERSLSLAAYLDAAWLVGYAPEKELAHFEDMYAKARELKRIGVDEQLTLLADDHIKKLTDLSPGISRPARS